MLDFDHAEMYQVETRVLKVKRNIERFPKGFMFQLTLEEWDSRRCVKTKAHLLFLYLNVFFLYATLFSLIW